VTTAAAAFPLASEQEMRSPGFAAVTQLKSSCRDTTSRPGFDRYGVVLSDDAVSDRQGRGDQIDVSDAPASDHRDFSCGRILKEIAREDVGVGGRDPEGGTDVHDRRLVSPI